MSETNFSAATATAIVPEFEEALKSIDVEIETNQDPEALAKERKAIYDAIREVEKTDIRETADVFAAPAGSYDALDPQVLHRRAGADPAKQTDS